MRQWYVDKNFSFFLSFSFDHFLLVLYRKKNGGSVTIALSIMFLITLLAKCASEKDRNDIQSKHPRGGAGEERRLARARECVLMPLMLMPVLQYDKKS